MLTSINKIVVNLCLKFSVAFENYKDPLLPIQVTKHQGSGAYNFRGPSNFLGCCTISVDVVFILRLSRLLGIKLQTTDDLV